MQTLLPLLLGILPAILWLAIFSPWLRRRSKLHIKTVLEIFFIGIAITIPAVLVELAIESVVGLNTTGIIALVLSATLIIAPIEEAFKFISLRILGSRIQFALPHDFLAAGIIIGIGFATVENILLAFQDSSLTLLTLRGVTATLLHITTAGIIGFYFALNRQTSRSHLPWQGLVVASLIHGVYNLLVTLPSTYGLVLVAIFMLMSIFFLFIASTELNDEQNTPPPS